MEQGLSVEGARPAVTMPVRVALVDDELMVLQGLEAWLSTASTDVTVVAAVSSWHQLLTHPAYPVDVVLLDLDLRDGLPVEVKIATLRSAGVATVVVSTHADPAQIRACVDAGARAYLAKSDPAEEMVGAAVAAAHGHDYVTPALAALLVSDREAQAPRLSPQETRAFTLYASGLPMKAVARRLHVSHDTAKGYVDRVRAKYEQVGRSARTKVQLYQRAVEDGYLAQALAPGALEASALDPDDLDQTVDQPDLDRPHHLPAVDAPA